jgi:hypothetical protein
MPKSTFPAAASGLPASGPLGRIPAGARANVIPVAEMPRRAFLSQLAALPLIGGGLSLIGAPHAVAEPVTPELLDAYKSWLLVEYVQLHQELHPYRKPDFGFNPNNSGGMYHWPYGKPYASPASARAALVLSTVGCDWKTDTWRRRSDV